MSWSNRSCCICLSAPSASPDILVLITSDLRQPLMALLSSPHLPFNGEVQDPAFVCAGCHSLVKEYGNCRRRISELEAAAAAARKSRVTMGDFDTLNASLTTAARCTSNTNRSRTDGRIDHQDIEGGRYLGEQKQSRLPDPLRQIFELNKEDFVDAGFCAFCCTNEKDHHAECGEDSSGRPFSCPRCPSVFGKFSSRQRHVLTVHCPNAPYSCSSCEKKFKLAAKLAVHQKTCVDGVRFACKECPKVFVSMRNLRDHINVTHDKTGKLKRHVCHVCQARFYKHSNLQSHLLCHSNMRSFICKHQGCQKAFKREGSLRLHVQAQHSEVKRRYLCTDCGKAFGTHTGMKLHASKHTGVAYGRRDFQCDDCSKTFRSRADLAIHRVVHTKEKPYRCNECGTGFTQKASLTEHNNVHLNKYQCVDCQKSFGRQRYLDQHVKICPRRIKCSDQDKYVPSLEQGDNVPVTQGVQIFTDPTEVMARTVPVSVNLCLPIISTAPDE